MSTLAEIEMAADALPQEEKQRLLRFLVERLQDGSVRPEPKANEATATEGDDDAVEWGVRGTHSVLDIPPMSVGKILRPLSADDDLLGEMLEDRL